MNTIIEKELVELYVANIALIENGLPSFINRHRGEAIEAFNLNGLPNKKGEKYRYCDVKKLFDGRYEKYFDTIQTSDSFRNEVGSCEKLPIESYEINLLNGFCTDIHVEDNGIVYGSLKAAANMCPQVIEQYYNSLAENATDSLAALNTAFMQDGAFIYVPSNVVAEKPFAILNCLSSDEDIYVYVRNLMIFEKGSQAEVIIDSHNTGNKAFLVNSLTETFAGQNTNIEIVEFQRENEETIHFQNSYAKLDNDSNYQTTIITTGGRAVRNNTNAILSGRGAEFHNYGLYLASGSQFIDNYTTTTHNVPNCTSFERYKGVAADSATGVFEGVILVAKDAQQTNAFMENHNILLSDDATIYTKPQLEIYADDVKCNHGATIGQLDADAIFYMRQRGIDETQAKKLQMYGFINDIVGKVKISSVIDFINSLAIKKIEGI